MNTETTAPVAAEIATAPDSAPSADHTANTDPATPDPQALDPAATAKQAEEKRIERLERRLHKQHSEKAYAQAEANQLRQRLEALEARQPQQPRESVQVDRQEVERHIQSRAQQLANQDRTTDRINSFVDRGTKEFPDFAQAVKAVADDLPLLNANGTPTEALQEILEADNPQAMLVYLSKNPDTLQELADLTPKQLTRRLMKLEGEMKQPTRQPSNAAKPLEPVKGASQKGEPDPSKDGKGWIKWRNEQVAKK